MNRELKRVAVVISAMFFSLLISSTIIQGVQADSLSLDQRNVRSVYDSYQVQRGDILIDGKVVKFAGPGDAMASGIGMVHQHFMLIPVFTVAENVILGHEPTKVAGVLDLDAARATRAEADARDPQQPVAARQGRSRRDARPAR